MNKDLLFFKEPVVLPARDIKPGYFVNFSEILFPKLSPFLDKTKIWKEIIEIKKSPNGSAELWFVDEESNQKFHINIYPFYSRHFSVLT